MNITLESLYARTAEVGNCREWIGRMQHGVPQVHIGKANGSCHYRTVRRVIMELERGEPIPQRLRATMKCDNPLCIAREHIVLRTYKQMGAMQGKHTPSAAASLARARRSRADVKLSAEKAREIRLSELNGTELAAIYGVNRTLISAIRRGKVWREGVQGASVFALV